MKWIDTFIEGACKWFLHFFKNENTRNKLAKLVNREVVTYLISGFLTTLVNWIVSFLFNDIIKLSSATVTGLIAWIAAVAFAYWINSSWVFQEKKEDSKSVIVKILKFFGSRVATGVIEIGVPGLLVDVLEFPFWPVKIIVSIAVIVLNYVFSKLFVFKKKSDSVEEKDAQEEK